ncbi:hypothetical protein [Pontiella sp.]|uniref:hypothetical protein n=1 Tax=Pontiella sp. TaxID=2837462 RepID=UPI0035687CB4
MNRKAVAISAMLVLGAYGETNRAFAISFPRSTTSFRGGSVYRFRAGLDGGGDFSVNRYAGDFSIGRMWDFDSFASVTFGLGQDDYRFSGRDDEPWNNINNYRLGLFVRKGVGEHWTLFAAPSVRNYAQAGVGIASDEITGAFFGGATYRFNDRLSLGPALGIVEQLEDSVGYFPALLVNWEVTERLSIETGSGLAATAGPGLAAIYALDDHWKIGLAGRYEKKRFRLDDHGVAPRGVGEDRNVPIHATLAYFLYPRGFVSLMLGYDFNGSLGLFAADGDKIEEIDYGSAVSAGIYFSFKL